MPDIELNDDVRHRIEGGAMSDSSQHAFLSDRHTIRDDQDAATACSSHPPNPGLPVSPLFPPM